MEPLRVNFALIGLNDHSNSWKKVNLIINKRDNISNIEFHKPSKDREYPLKEFIETGRNKITGYMVIAPEKDEGIEVLNKLDKEDIDKIIFMLKIILNNLEKENVDTSSIKIDIKFWKDIIKNLINSIEIVQGL